MSKNLETLYYQSEPLDEVLDWKKNETAMLIVDLQNQFVAKDGEDIKHLKEIGEWEKWIPYYKRLDEVTIPANAKLIDCFRSNGMEVTYGVIACHHQDGRDRSRVQKRSGWNNILVPMGSYGEKVIKELEPRDDEIVVKKTTDSVPTGTNYSFLMRNMNIKNIVVTGIVTDQCVASTVRTLADEGFEVIVVEEACAAATEELHYSELRIMNKLYCEVMALDETIEFINSLE